MTMTRLVPQRRGLALLSAVLLSACTVGPDFHRPVTVAPERWGDEAADIRSTTYAGAVDSRWWDSFHDPELSRLVDRLGKQNLDLQAAAERVIQGRSQIAVAISQGLPHIDYEGQYTRTRQSPKGFISLVTPAPGAPYEYDLFRNALTASWELDLFGRVRRSVEAARAGTEAAIEARHQIALVAISDLAQSYLQLRGAQALEAIARDNLGLAHRNLELVRTQFANGVSTTLDVANAQAQEARIASTLPGYKTAEDALINAIGLELAQPPRALEAELSVPAALPLAPPRVPVGLPAQLARRRPDIRQAEAQLHEATAATGVAVASFYPDVTLNGSFGPEGLRFQDAFSLPSRAAAVGPTIDLPLFQGGRLRGTLRLRKSQQREAAISYQRTVLAAWNDVDNALTAYAQAQKQREDAADVVKQTDTALDAARQQYQQGAVDFLNVISAQAALLSAQSTLADADTRITTDLVALYRALGGGWEGFDQPQERPVAAR
ncbi:efflux transporter outer membrane subunit [Rhizosaccharibacter radicis]|uniref:Efflux transporter outer membrane subunit n=1 Tax=Rhizosaccharibacter radicis TaxID=2782605 RepID=A0ABT1VWN0_9PROT|nr:efflux transporter outer membrane subunit [Acetobacteraceae bacterium KSS12]